MKKITVLGVALATMASVALVSCQKDGARITEFTATVEHCTDASGKVLMDGNVLRWTDGDQIAVWGSDGMGTYTTTNVGEYVTTFNFTEGDDPGDPTYTAIYPASLAQRQAVILLPPVQTSTDGSLQQFPMMARSSSSELVFKNLCGALRLRLQATGKSVVGIELATANTSQRLWGMHQLVYNNGNPTISLIANGGNQVMLSITNPQDISTAKDFYIALPPATYGAGFTIMIYTSDGSVCTKTITSGHSFSIERSSIFTITLGGNDMEFEPDAGTLNGEFSVSPTKKVRFSQGSLMYTGFGTHKVADGGTATGTWKFDAVRYYDVNSLSSYDYLTQWIHGFPWGTSGWNSGAIHYQPYPEPYQGGMESNYYLVGGSPQNDLIGPYAYADWGVYNAILNGGNQPQQWRTLSAEEWQYLLFERRGHSVKWGVANVVNSYRTYGGLVILPDNWVLPDGVDFNEGLGFNGFNLNYYTAEQWTKMENAGAVFIVNGSWTSTHSNRGSNTQWESYGLSISWHNVEVSGIQRDAAPKVRLVKDVN